MDSLGNSRLRLGKQFESERQVFSERIRRISAGDDDLPWGDLSLESHGAEPSHQLNQQDFLCIEITR